MAVTEDYPWQLALEVAIKSCLDMVLNTTISVIILTGEATEDEVKTEMYSIMERMPSEVHHYWGAPCDCHQGRWN